MPQKPFETAELAAIRDAIKELRQRLLEDTSPDQRRLEHLAWLWGLVNDRLAQPPPQG